MNRKKIGNYFVQVFSCLAFFSVSRHICKALLHDKSMGYFLYDFQLSSQSIDKTAMN